MRNMGYLVFVGAFLIFLGAFVIPWIFKIEPDNVAEPGSQNKVDFSGAPAPKPAPKSKTAPAGKSAGAKTVGKPHKILAAATKTTCYVVTNFDVAPEAGQPQFAGYLAHTVEPVQDAEFTEELRDLLVDFTLFKTSGKKKFRPDGGFRLTGADGEVEVAVDFETNQMAFALPAADGPSTRGKPVLIPAGIREKLLELAKRAFPNEQRIQQLS